jgi:hypothetical protein
MKTKKYLIVVFFSIIGLIGLRSQTLNDSLNYKLKNIISDVINKKHIPDNIFKKTELETVCDLLPQYEKLPNSDVQYYIFYTYYRIAQTTIDESIKHKMLNFMLRACGDTISDSYECGQISELLKTFCKQDFDETSRNTIINKLKKGKCLKNIILIGGMLELRETEPILRRMLTDKYCSFKWEIHLALARMGFKEEISYCIKSVNFDSLVNDFDYKDWVQISYIKSKESIELLNKVLNSEKRLSQIKENVLGSKVATMAIHLLIHDIKKFPIKLNEAVAYSDKEIDIARQWMKAHKNNYVINRDVY